MSYPCAGCGKFLFSKPRHCYWCSNPRERAEILRLVEQGVAHAIETARARMRAWELQDAMERAKAGKRPRKPRGGA